MDPQPAAPPARALVGALRLGVALACLVLSGCRTLPDWLGSPADPDPATDPDAGFYRRVQQERTEWLEREVERLSADLLHAEASMVAIESGLRGIHTRADAVSSVAESRIAVERASHGAPWRDAQIREAREKLDEAERQLQAGHFGSAVFFASRAHRIADTLDEEATRVADSTSARFVGAARVNLRSGPSTDSRVLDVLTEATPVFSERREGDWMLVRTLSGQIGWVHAGLLHGR